MRAERLATSRRWRTARGSALDAVAGDWLLSDGRGEWTVAADVFARAYRPQPDGTYVKIATVQAVRIEEPVEVPTPEGRAGAEPGDWLLRGVDGELWPVTDDFFRAHTPVTEAT